MAESGRDPLIRLPIDQEIYVDAVHDGDIVEDVTVAAEVISLEREEAVYEMEGAIVFAGYVRTNMGEAGGDVHSDTAKGTSDAGVEHIHHRLPFRLRVPVSAQQQGVINIKSRLSQFEAVVVSDNWLNLKGNLEIHGLYSTEGYHFRCGAQEEGNAFFVDEAVPMRHQSPDDETDATEETNSDVSQAEDESAELVGMSGEWRSAPDEGGLDSDEEDNRSQSLAEKVSEGRGGHGWAEKESNAGDDAKVSGEETVQPIRNELVNLDRHFVQERSKGVSEQSDASGQDNARSLPVASFEFEHEIEEEVAEQRKTDAVQQEAEMFRAQTDEEDEAGWRPRFTIAGSVESAQEDANTAIDAAEDTETDAPDRHELSASSVTYSDLWSFVDFNGPEPKHTMRYVIVMEEESIDSLADRCGCLPSELQRVNRLDDGQIRPGQALYIPSQPIALHHLSVS